MQFCFLLELDKRHCCIHQEETPFDAVRTATVMLKKLAKTELFRKDFDHPDYLIYLPKMFTTFSVMRIGK
jgi:hypothetical protein